MPAEREALLLAAPAAAAAAGDTNPREGKEGGKEGRGEEGGGEEGGGEEGARKKGRAAGGRTAAAPPTRPATKSVGEGSGRREREARGERQGGGGDDRAPLHGVLSPAPAIVAPCAQIVEASSPSVPGERRSVWLTWTRDPGTR